MLCKWRSMLGGIAVATLVGSCADAGGGVPSRARPSESTFCRIVLGSSTPADVGRILGAPSDSYQTQNSLSYTYAYGDVLEGSLSHLILSFDDGVASDPFASGFPLPSCWEDGQTSAGLDL